MPALIADAPQDAVDYCHSLYSKYQKQWVRCKDVIDGQDAVKDKGEAYLRRLSGQDKTPEGNAAYMGYLDRAAFFNATGRTVDALTGLVNAKQPVTKIPEAMKPMLKDITLSGVTVAEFHNELLEQVIGIGRCGVLVDHPTNDTTGLTVAQAKALNLRPYARIYHALAIRNWRTVMVNGRELLTMVVLEETHCNVGSFSSIYETQYRVLDLTDEGYRQRLYRMSDDTSKGYLTISIGKSTDGGDLYEIYPRMAGKPMREIPFRFLNVDNSKPEPQVSPLLDLVDTNLSHYKNSADYENGLHYTGLPQPWIAGATLEPGTKLTIGSPNAWAFLNPEAKAQYLEFSGQGLKPLADAMAAKERKMAVLGARMLADEKAAAEAVEAIEIRFGGENSVLSSIARTVSQTMEWVLQKLADWSQISGEISYQLNTDYHLTQMKAPLVLAIIQAWQAGAITQETVFSVLQKGEIIDAFEEVNKYVADAKAQKTAADDAVAARTAAASPDAGMMSSLRNKLGLGGK